MCAEVWALDLNSFGLWNDVPCGATRGYVCETYKGTGLHYLVKITRKTEFITKLAAGCTIGVHKLTILDINGVIDVNPNSPRPCVREDYTSFWYGCYKKHRSLQIWDAARDICAGERATLVTIIADAENAAVQLATADDDLPVWTGGRDIGVRNFHHITCSYKYM